MKVRFKRNHILRIPLECDNLESAALDGRDIAHKYVQAAGAFLFGFDAVAELPDQGVLEVRADNKTTRIDLEVI